MSEPEAWHEEGKAQLKKDKKHSRGGSSSVESAGSSGSGRDRSTGQSSESGGSNSPTTICRINDGYMLYLIAMHDHVRKKHLDTLGLRGDQESLSQDMNSMSAMNDLVFKELQRSWAAMQESKKEEWRSQATTFEEQDSGDKPASFRSCIFSSDFDNGDDASASTASGNGESADGWDTSVYPSTVGEHLSGSPEDSPGQVCASDLSSASTKRTNDGTRDPRKKGQKEAGSGKDHFSRMGGSSKARAAKAGSKAPSDEAKIDEQKDDNDEIKEDNDEMEDDGKRSSHTSKKSANRKRFLRENDGEKGQPLRQHPRIDGGSSSSKNQGGDASSTTPSSSTSTELEKTAKKVVQVASSSSQGKDSLSKGPKKLATLSEGKDSKESPEVAVKTQGFTPVREGSTGDGGSPTESDGSGSGASNSASAGSAGSSGSMGSGPNRSTSASASSSMRGGHTGNSSEATTFLAGMGRAPGGAQQPGGGVTTTFLTNIDALLNPIHGGIPSQSWDGTGSVGGIGQIRGGARGGVGPGLTLQEISATLHQPLPITMQQSVIGGVQHQGPQSLLGAPPGLGLGHLNPQQQHFLVSLGMLPPHAQQHAATHPMMFAGSGPQAAYGHPAQFAQPGFGGSGGSSPFSAVGMSKKQEAGGSARTAADVAAHIGGDAHATARGHGVFVGGGGGYGGAGHGFSGVGTEQHSIGNSSSRLWSEPPQVRTLTLVCDLFSPHKGSVNLAVLAENFVLKEGNGVIGLSCQYKTEEGVDKVVSRGQVKDAKRHFAHQAQLRLSLPGSPNISVKVFSTGRLQIAGCREEHVGQLAVRTVAEGVNEIMAKGQSVISRQHVCGPVSGTNIEGPLDLDRLPSPEIVMINCSFDAGFERLGYGLHPRVLTDVIRSMNHPGVEEVSYTPELHYTGVKVKYRSSDVMCKSVDQQSGSKKEAFIGIFPSGKAVITGASAWAEVESAYGFARGTLAASFEQIKVPLSDMPASRKKKFRGGGGGGMRGRKQKEGSVKEEPDDGEEDAD